MNNISDLISAYNMISEARDLLTEDVNFDITQIDEVLDALMVEINKRLSP